LLVQSTDTSNPTTSPQRKPEVQEKSTIGIKAVTLALQTSSEKEIREKIIIKEFKAQKEVNQSIIFLIMGIMYV
jgi:hypothetical protein